jgi:hypothetical protein
MSPVQKPQLSTVRSHSQNADGATVSRVFPVDSQAYDYYWFSNS